MGGEEAVRKLRVGLLGVVVPWVDLWLSLGVIGLG